MRVGVIFFNFIGPGAVRPTSSGAWIHELGTHLGYFRSSHFSSRKFRWALNEIFALKLLTQIVYKFKSEISSRNFGKSKLIPTKIFIGERVSSKKLFQKIFFVKEIMIWDGPKVWTKIDGTECFGPRWENWSRFFSRIHFYYLVPLCISPGDDSSIETCVTR